MEQLNFYGLAALITFVSVFVLTLLGVKFFPKLKMLDRPEKYGLKRAPIPYFGGILFFVPFVILVLVFCGISNEILGFLIAASLIAMTGLLDDKFNISPWVRLFVQIVSGLIIAVFGLGILSITNPFGGVIDLNTVSVYGVPLLGALFTIFWVVLVTNTMNFLDGVPGLSSGVSFISSFTIFFLSIRPGIHADLASQQTVATISIILAFCCLAFLIFDFPPVKILMGNVGSNFLGFVLAALAIFSGGKVATAFLVLGVPILDAAWVILKRIFEGRKPWKGGDYKHLHHRLLALGLSEKNVLFVVYVLCLIFGATAVLCTNAQQKFFVLIGLLILMLLIVSGIVVFSRRLSKK